MNHFLQFIGTHWYLCTAFIVVLFGIFYLEARTAGAVGSNRLTPQMLTHMVNRESAVVIDIRDTSVYRDGHIVNAINVPTADWDVQQKKLEKHKSVPVIIVDAMGQKVMPYAMKLKKAGFDQVKVLGGGMQAWRQAKLPVMKGVK